MLCSAAVPPSTRVGRNASTVGPFGSLRPNRMLDAGARRRSRRGLSFFEARSHFSAWSIVSSPLVLSMDVNDDAVMDQVWEIVSNKE